MSDDDPGLSPSASFNAQLASHETILRHLTALIVKMDTAIHELKDGQALIITLLHRREADDTRNGV
jgi:exonuclease VII small subunit